MTLVDSSVWVGLMNKEDAHYARAISDFESLKSKGERIMVSDYVIVEVSSVIMRQGGKVALLDFLKRLESDRAIEIVNTGGETLQALIRAFRNFPKGLSFVDASLLIVARDLGEKLLTYDEELKKAV